MTEPPSAVNVEEILAASVLRILRQTGCTKKSAVRHALIEAIHSGVLRPGDMLPPERRLAEALSLSLGTVQAALDPLRQTGRIIRRRGDGSRVADGDDMFQQTWHFRFLDRRTARPVFWGEADVQVEEVTGPGPWLEFLGDSGPYIRVRRKIPMLGGLPVGSDMYLSAETGGPLLKMNMTDLALVNLRAMLAERFGIISTRVATQISTCELSLADAQNYGIRQDVQAFQIDAQVFGVEDSPLYFHRVLAACDDFILKF